MQTEREGVNVYELMCVGLSLTLCVCVCVCACVRARAFHDFELLRCYVKFYFWLSCNVIDRATTFVSHWDEKKHYVIVMKANT